jgi:hypothetical protein
MADIDLINKLTVKLWRTAAAALRGDLFLPCTILESHGQDLTAGDDP